MQKQTIFRKHLTKDFGNLVVWITIWNLKEIRNCQKNINCQNYMVVKKSKNTINTLPLSTIIEVVATKGNQVFKERMKYGEALQINKKTGWNYVFYKDGFCSIKSTIKNK